MKTEVEDTSGDGACDGGIGGSNLACPEGTSGLVVGPETSPGVMECGGCGERVRERTVLCVGGRTWHSRCLRCCACARPLHDQHSCFLRGMRLYCRHDYALAFGAKCAKCGRSVGAGDWVRRARERVYHLACFACDACSRQLSTGEQFALVDARLLCKAHYLDVVEGNNTSSDGGDSESGHKGGNKAKRVRTTFTEEQLSVLQANFQLDSNPDGQDLERIAHVTGLSKRVTQVWFQNSRARQKKHLHTGKMKGQHGKLYRALNTFLISPLSLSLSLSILSSLYPIPPPLAPLSPPHLEKIVTIMTAFNDNNCNYNESVEDRNFYSSSVATKLHRVAQRFQSSHQLTSNVLVSTSATASAATTAAA
ncbi:LIM/homeobox protein Awh-like isoform X2 [Cataglyphis hispanica]|uniref:LIM/homeobox protein Awh-like isoform X2 n=1 Tax=Cataglyphis hispanica TaxID=1086592 RepID=UPI00217FE769|nr:LIM/homeobox protein Awh-like isoform X2 [Cataglyphis hispanica]